MKVNVQPNSGIWTGKPMADEWVQKTTDIYIHFSYLGMDFIQGNNL